MRWMWIRRPLGRVFSVVCAGQNLSRLSGKNKVTIKIVAAAESVDPEIDEDKVAASLPHLTAPQRVDVMNTIWAARPGSRSAKLPE